MKKILLLVVVMLVVGVMAVTVGASPTADCEAFASGSIPQLTSLDIPFSCQQQGTVYFGVCDSGPVPDDDEFNIVFNNVIVASNWYSGGEEFAYIGSAQAAAGSHVAVLNSVNPAWGATYSYAISTNQAAVTGYLQGACGADFGGTANIGGQCVRNVPVFTTDTAPTNGKVSFNVQFGEMNREEGRALKTWNLKAGERINNATVPVPAPQYVRVWWQPEGDSEWYLMTSQYWQGGGDTDSEYGIDCELSGVPSYHTSFAGAVPEAEVPLLPQ
ncbi:MAG: hypothetical protein M5U34_47680 [Chloroflexi bacterium]|nr:hypothetical protein [Chloroflexota bacterium]